MITLYHFCFNVDRLPFGLANRVISESWVAVDIFMLLSGFGIYVSLSKSGRLFSEYIKRRALRILPAYYLVIIVYLIVCGFRGGLKLREIVANLTFTAYWNDYLCQFNWYTSVIVVFYLIAPLFFYFISRSEKKGLTSLFICIAVVVFNLGFIDHSGYSSISRLPVFIYGMYLGSRYMDEREDYERKIWIPYIAVSLIVMVAGFYLIYLGDNFLYSNMSLWTCFECYVSGITAPGIIICSIGLMELLYRIPYLGRLIKNVIETIGKASYEIYLIHLLILFINPGLSYEKNAIKVPWILGSILLGILYRYIVEKIKSNYNS